MASHDHKHQPRLAMCVFLFSSGSVINLASGIRGLNYGVRLHSGGTLTNAGTIVGSSGPAVAFRGHQR